MSKEFKTVDQLIEKMKLRNIIVDENTKPALLRESYYAIVNGYKAPFLDTNNRRTKMFTSRALGSNGSTRFSSLIEICDTSRSNTFPKRRRS